MQEHEKNINQVIDHTREELAGRIKTAEAQNKIPEEAVICTITNTIVFWGDALERKRFRRKWIDQQAQSMKGKMQYQLKKLGRTVGVTKMGNGKGEIWNIWDTAEVHMSDDARNRVEQNASEEEYQKNEEAKQKSKEFELENQAPREPIDK